MEDEERRRTFYYYSQKITSSFLFPLLTKILEHLNELRHVLPIVEEVQRERSSVAQLVALTRIVASFLGTSAHLLDLLSQLLRHHQILNLDLHSLVFLQAEKRTNMLLPSYTLNFSPPSYLKLSFSEGLAHSVASELWTTMAALRHLRKLFLTIIARHMFWSRLMFSILRLALIRARKHRTAVWMITTLDSTF